MGGLRIKTLSPAKGRTLFIGDVHGCVHELEKLLKVMKPGRKDRVIFVGDLINRGPDSARVLEIARDLSAHCVLGNHEVRFLKARKGKSARRLKRKDREAFESLSKADWKWMNAWPHLIHIPGQKYLVVHGGFDPALAWWEQDEDRVTEIQVITRKKKPARRSSVPKGAPWADAWEGPEHVIYGHTPRPHPLLHARATGLDTGCVYGYALTAISLPDHTIYRVPALQRYYDD